MDHAVLHPYRRYLRVTSEGVAALLVLGFVDKDPAGRPIQVWYSAGQEVLRLQGGRLVGLTGTPVEWRQVMLPADLPAWESVQAPRTFVRQRDQMPGYHIAITEDVEVRPMDRPGSGALQQVDPASLTWFEERNTAPSDLPPSLARHATPLPPARYALRRAGATLTPVYGEQCLDAKFCIQWQTWPPTPTEN